jgi:soluble lytic murein transglycosylase-like protein
MYKYILLLLPTITFGLDKSKHPIYYQILQNNPSINKPYAFSLSNKIYKITRKYKIDSNIFTAILAQESMYNNDAKNCTKGLNKDFELQKVCTDIGIGQIHYSTVLRYDLEPKKIINDLDYSLNVAAKVLSDIKKRWIKKEPRDYWTRYNASTPEFREIYEINVKRFFR